MLENLKKQIEIIKKLIRYYQLQLAIKKNGDRPTQKQIIGEIRAIALARKVDPDLAVKVAICESGLDPFAINFNKDASIDRGLYQWNDRWHPEISDVTAFNYLEATRLFCQAIKEGHLSWWNSSRTCWSK